jgi:hypothetical protein
LEVDVASAEVVVADGAVVVDAAVVGVAAVGAVVSDLTFLLFFFLFCEQISRDSIAIEQIDNNIPPATPKEA